VLPKFDENSTVLFQDLQCPQSTSLVASLERDFLLLGVFEFVSLVERGSVAVAASVSTRHSFHA
jgi:hypothetical protein